MVIRKVLKQIRLLVLYGVGHMVKYQSESKRRNLLLPHGLLLLVARVILYAQPHRQDSTHNSLCYTSRGALAGRKKGNVLFTVIWCQTYRKEPFR